MAGSAATDGPDERDRPCISSIAVMMQIRIPPPSSARLKLRFLLFITNPSLCPTAVHCMPPVA
jgi:hypothetical protein